MKLEDIKKIQEIFGSVDFDVFCTADEDKGLHIAHNSLYMGAKFYDGADSFEYDFDYQEEEKQALEEGKVLFETRCGLFLKIKKDDIPIINQRCVKCSSKRETVFIDWYHLYEDHYKN